MNGGVLAGEVLRGRGRPGAALVVVLAIVAVLVVPAPEAEAYATVPLSSRETLVVLTPWETSFMLNNLRSQTSGTWCSAPGGGRVSAVLRVMNRLCSGHNMRNQVLYYRVRWLLYNAALRGACGAFVVRDGWLGASLRSPYVWNPWSRSWVTHAWTNLGEVAAFRRERGWVRVRCGEYRSPHTMSPLPWTRGER